MPDLSIAGIIAELGRVLHGHSSDTNKQSAEENARG